MGINVLDQKQVGVKGKGKGKVNPPIQGTGNPKFRSIMGLEAARLVLLNGSRGVKFGGGTQRTGMIARSVMGTKFGNYKPSDCLDVFRGDTFPADFKKAVEAWRNGWDPAVSADTQKMRENQYKATMAFLNDGGFARIADAIESMLAARSNQVSLEDNAGNIRVMSLIDACDLFLGIRMTTARAASLKISR